MKMIVELMVRFFVMLIGGSSLFRIKMLLLMEIISGMVQPLVLVEEMLLGL